MTAIRPIGRTVNGRRTGRGKTATPRNWGLVRGTMGPNTTDSNRKVADIRGSSLDAPHSAHSTAPGLIDIRAAIPQNGRRGQVRPARRMALAKASHDRRDDSPPDFEMWNPTHPTSQRLPRVPSNGARLPLHLVDEPLPMPAHWAKKTPLGPHPSARPLQRESAPLSVTRNDAHRWTNRSMGSLAHTVACGRPLLAPAARPPCANASAAKTRTNCGRTRTASGALPRTILRLRRSNNSTAASAPTPRTHSCRSSFATPPRSSRTVAQQSTPTPCSVPKPTDRSGT
jgi:hypothetical protein